MIIISVDKMVSIYTCSSKSLISLPIVPACLTEVIILELLV